MIVTPVQAVRRKEERRRGGASACSVNRGAAVFCNGPKSSGGGIRTRDPGVITLKQSQTKTKQKTFLSLIDHPPHDKMLSAVKDRWHRGHGLARQTTVILDTQTRHHTVRPKGLCQRSPQGGPTMTVYPLPRGPSRRFAPPHRQQAIAILFCMVLELVEGYPGTEARPAGQCAGLCLGETKSFVKKNFRSTRHLESSTDNRLVSDSGPRRPAPHKTDACDHHPNLRLCFGRLQGRSRRILSLHANSRECLMFWPHFPPVSFPQQPGLFVSQQEGDQ
jgi:hypothetical protein